MGDAVLRRGVLDSLETVAPTPDAGRHAFFTWSLVQSFGWAEARRLVPKSTWHRHMRLLASAGLPVPLGREISAEVPSLIGSGWFGASSHAEAAKTVTAAPGRLLELINRRFQVVMPEEGAAGRKRGEAQPADARPPLRLVRPALPWSDLGPFCPGERRELQEWTVGVQGVVVCVVFDGQWRVELEHDDWRLQDAERWARVDLAEFLRCTWPLEVSA